MTEQEKPPTVPAPEAAAVAVAEELAGRVLDELATAPHGHSGAVQARATLALAASVDALREALSSRLDELNDLLIRGMR